jgi:CarboxypepD_reg-like domain
VSIFDRVKRILFYTILLSLLLPSTAKSQFETSRDSVVQLYGVIMTADSLVGIPAVSVMVKGQNRGTITNGQGVFSIVVLKGDQVEFTHVTYKPKTIEIPRGLEGNQYSVVQLLVIDTVYLPATIIRPRPTAEQFARDFVNTKVPDDNIEIARQNTDAAKRRVLLTTIPGDGGEATKLQFNKIASKAVYSGQIPPMNIFNPAAWADFIQAWKRGDFKNKH